MALENIPAARAQDTRGNTVEFRAGGDGIELDDNLGDSLYLSAEQTADLMQWLYENFEVVDYDNSEDDDDE